MKPVVLAPMAGVTDKPFRQMVRLFGQQTLWTEMIGVESLSRNHPMTRKMMDVGGEQNVIVQLVGVNPAAFAEAARLVSDSGAVGIDINMGCPVKKLIANGSGAALLKTPDTAARLLEVVKKNTTLPVSVKMRTGWDAAHINAVPLARMLANAGADLLTIHARTKEQGYSGTPVWDVVRQVKAAVSVPVYANGDVTDITSAEKVLQLTGADGVMVGRGALGKPWILSAIETGTTPAVDKAALACRHLDLLLDYYGPHGVYVARKHIGWYARGQKNVADFCQRVYTMTDIQQLKETIEAFFKGG